MRRTRSVVAGLLLLPALAAAAAAQEPKQVLIESKIVVTYGASLGWAFPFGSDFEALESGPTVTGHVGFRPSGGTVGGELQVGYTRLGVEDFDDAHFRILDVNAVITKTIGSTVLLGGVTYGNGKAVFDGDGGDSDNAFGVIIAVRQRLGGSSVPILGSIPVLGQFFKGDSGDGDKRSLLILVKPSITVQGDNES
jgi:hypothetical protein